MVQTRPKIEAGTGSPAAFPGILNGHRLFREKENPEAWPSRYLFAGNCPLGDIHILPDCVYNDGPSEMRFRLPVETNNQTPADEKVAQLLREAALETDSDKLLALYRKIAKLDEEKLNEQKSNEEKSRGS